MVCFWTGSSLGWPPPPPLPYTKVSLALRLVQYSIGPIGSPPCDRDTPPGLGFIGLVGLIEFVGFVGFIVCAGLEVLGGTIPPHTRPILIPINLGHRLAPQKLEVRRYNYRAPC